MRKTVIAGIAILLSMSVSASVSYAGSINGPEAGLIHQASGTFEYQGKTYKATSSAIGQLTSYLSRDGVDLTQEQANRAASLMYSNVKSGVLDGYLTPIGGASENTDAGKNSAAPRKDSNSVLNRPNSTSSRAVTKEKAGSAQVKVRDSRSALQVVNADGQEILKAELPVKDTGFSYSGPILTLGSLLLLSFTGIAAAWKLRLFADIHAS